MAFYRNTAAGARMIRLAGRVPYRLVEAGETVEISDASVVSIPAGVVRTDEDGEAIDVPEIPADVVALARKKAPAAKDDVIIPTVEEVLSAEVVEDAPKAAPKKTAKLAATKKRKAGSRAKKRGG
jgi:hypothetical protein